MIDHVVVITESGPHPVPIMIDQENPKQVLNEYLHNDVCRVTFTKVDGSERVMLASMRPEFVDPIRPVEKPLAEGEEPKPKKPDNPNILTVVDTEIGQWRSIKIDSITSFEIL